MIAIGRPFIRISFLAVFLIVLYTFGTCHERDRDPASSWTPVVSFGPRKEHLYNSLNLNEKQCRAAFPDLTKEIEQAAARGPFELRKSGDYVGLVQARIKDGKLYLVALTRDIDMSRTKLFERSAVLHQLYRAIVTSPSPLPDTYLSFVINDTPKNNSWSFTRENVKSGPPFNVWLMPHFGYWSWPEPFIGTFDEISARIRKVVRNSPWEKRIDKVVWRGSLFYNPIGNKNLRSQLVDVTRGKDWADVEGLDWQSGAHGASNLIRLEDFCKYKYIIYTEGVTYSGRLPYHQACGSVIITPAINYLLHTTHLMKPLFSSTLFPKKKDSADTSYRDKLIKLTWPRQYAPSEANIVFVSPDWSDLEDTIQYLRVHPSIAKRIAQKQRELTVDRGYHSPAAETCYWRALIQAWSRMANPTFEGDGSWGTEEGVRWETYAISGWPDGMSEIKSRSFARGAHSEDGEG